MKVYLYLYQDPRSDTQVAQRQQVRGSIIQVIRHRESTSLRQNTKKSRRYHFLRLDSTTVLTYRRVVSHADKLVKIPPLHINCTQHLGHTDDSRSGVKMFLRVVILVFASTCCTARMIGKALHTRH